jgi:hypothetical protein
VPERNQSFDALLGLGLIVLVASVIAIPVILLIGGDTPGVLDRENVVNAARDVAGSEGQDPWRYDPERRAAFEANAAAGVAHVLFALSPGGVLATAGRTDTYRDEIEAATEGSSVDPDVLEALVFLESAGRSQVVASKDPGAAAGLAQILGETGTSLLGMSIDIERSHALTKAISRAEAEGDEERVEKLVGERAAIDPRFDPEQALAGAVRYLETASDTFGREDLAIESYHMGIGNLESVIRAFTGDDVTPVATLVDDQDLSYAQLYFDSSPARHAEAWEILASLGDESAEYLWKIYAAEGIMRLYREDRAELEALAALQEAKASQEEVFHPLEETETFADHGAIEDAINDGTLAPIPDDPSLGFRIQDRLGELADEVGADPAIYRALRPEALALLIYLSERVKSLNDGKGALTLTSAVRDQEYQDNLASTNIEATSEYSLHTTGWSFDILREYESKAQAKAFQFVLDRLQALNVIDYVYEPAAIHVTVSNRASALLSDGS